MLYLDYIIKNKKKNYFDARLVRRTSHTEWTRVRIDYRYYVITATAKSSSHLSKLVRCTCHRWKKQSSFYCITTGICLRSTNDAASKWKYIASNGSDWRVLTHQALHRHLPGRRISKSSVTREICGTRLGPGALLLFKALLMVEFTLGIEISALLLKLPGFFPWRLTVPCAWGRLSL
jgi:hypothetical protein